jgi:Protein of unknown function (DUF2934)
MATATEKKTAVAKKPAAVKKPAAKKPTVKKASKPSTSKASTAKTSTVKTSTAKISAAERYRMVETAAYFIAERNGFTGNSADYWIAAEAQIKKMLAK